MAISIFDLSHSRVALCFAKIFTKSELNQPVRTSLIAIFAAETLRHGVTLTFDPLTLKVCGTQCVTWSNSVYQI